MNGFYSYQIKFDELHISTSDLLEASGSFDPAQTEVLSAIAGEIIEMGPSLSEIHGAIVVDEAVLDGDFIWIGENKLSPGKKITSLLKPATHAAFFICTAGLGFEEVAHQEMGSGDVLKGYYTDLLGSLTVEKAMDIFQKQFAEELQKEGLGISNRYSPGYCDWQVADQFNLFQLFPENCCGVKLTSSALMSPVKSISGVIAVGTSVKYREHHCDLCSSKTCIYRKIRENQNGRVVAG